MDVVKSGSTTSINRNATIMMRSLHKVTPEKKLKHLEDHSQEEGTEYDNMREVVVSGDEGNNLDDTFNMMQNYDYSPHSSSDEGSSLERGP